MQVVGVSNRFVSSLFNPVFFPFPCTLLFSALLALAFPICLDKQEIEREKDRLRTHPAAAAAAAVIGVLSCSS
jgi:hypothetical protein